MALTYLSGGRIQGLSSPTAVTPTVAKTIFQGTGLESKWTNNSEDITYDGAGTFSAKVEDDSSDSYDGLKRVFEIQSGHELVGKTLTSVLFKFAAYASSGTGVYSINLYNSSGGVKHQFKTGNTSTLWNGGQSTYAEYTGNDNITSGTATARTVVAGDCLGFQNSGNADIRLHFRQDGDINRPYEICGNLTSGAFVAGSDYANPYTEVVYVAGAGGNVIDFIADGMAEGNNPSGHYGNTWSTPKNQQPSAWGSGSDIVDSVTSFDLQDSTALNGSNVSDTAWVLRFRLNITGYSSDKSSGSALAIGISSRSDLGSEDAIGFEIGVGTSDSFYRLNTVNGGTWAGATADAVFSATPKVENLYVEVTRLSAEQAKVSLYTDAAYSVLLEKHTVTIPAGIASLRYLTVKSDTQTQTNTLAGAVSDFELWNNTTTTTQENTDRATLTVANTDAGTRYEETDSRKIFRRVDGSGSTMPSAATGGTITTDGDYKVHSFTTTGSSTFTVTARASASPIELLVIAGGGGGGRAIGGSQNHWRGAAGAGAGGVRQITKTTLATGTDTFAVVVGTGGGTGYGNQAGATSTFATGTGDAVNATGGSGGLSGDDCNGTGGSGAKGGAGNAGGYDPVEGYAGGTTSGCGTGNPHYGTHLGGGGGGGAGGVGQNNASNTGGLGGIGISSSITGTSVDYAGGGSGGRGEHGGSNGASVGYGGGSGGGGSGTANTGAGGGGGGSESGAGGAGGTGIVIIRYKFQNFVEWKGKGVAA